MAFSIMASRKLQLVLAVPILLFIGLLFSSGKVYADCGINTGNIHDYAGLAVGVKAVDANGNGINWKVKNYNNVRIAVSTYGQSYTNQDGSVNPSGNGGFNLVRKDTGTRDDNKWFTPQSNPGGTSCPGTDYAIVLGYDNPTPDIGGGHFWLLDCDYSLRAEPGGPQYNVSNPYQKFAVYPAGSPTATNGQTIKSGGTWTVEAASFVPGNPGGGLPNSEIQNANSGNISGSNTQKIAPGNGATGRFVLIYHEPALTCQDTNTCPSSSTASCVYLQLSGAGSYKRTEVRVSAVNVTSESWTGNTSAKTGSGPGPAYPGFDEFINPTQGGDGGYINHTWIYTLGYPPYPGTPTSGYNGISISYDVESWDSSANNGNGAWTPWGGAGSGPVQYMQRNADGSTSWTTTASTVPCFKATCTINSVDGDGPGGMVMNGGAIHVNATITNNSYDNLLLRPPKLALTGTGGTYGAPDTIGPNDSTTFDFDVNGGATWPTAPATQLNLSFYTSYYPSNADSTVSPSDRISPDCSWPVTVYQYFTLQPVAEAYPDPGRTQENPGSIHYDTYVKNNSSATVSGPQTKSSFTTTPYNVPVTCANVGPIYSTGPYAGSANTYTIGPAACTPSSINAGDQYCSDIAFTNYNSGYVGSDGGIVPTGMSGPISSHQCVIIKNKPYFKIYNSGVSAGGAFATTGNCSGGGVLGGWNDNHAAPDRGAGSQLSALALIKITGVASAQASVPSSPLGAALTFANTGVAYSNDNESPSLGGNFNPTGSYCLTDVSAPPDATNNGASTITAGAGDYTHTGNLQLNGNSGISNDSSIFVNGDVYVGGDVKYNTGGWILDTDGTSNVPSFVLHATGNIYVDPSVKQLDGLYISNKKIYTCGSNNGGGVFTPVTAANMYGTCNQQLKVNGVFVATQVNLMRTYGSLRNATGNENPAFGSLVCSYSGGSLASQVCAGEIFQLSPEFYLSSPAIQLPNNGATQYDAITSLPPVL